MGVSCSNFLCIASECRFWPGILFIYRKNNRNMGKYLHHFTTTDDFANEYLFEGHQLPWVSYNDNPECVDMKKVVYNQMNYDAVVDMRNGQPEIIYDNVTSEDFGNPHNLRILVICDNCQIEEGAMTFDDGTYTYYMQNYGCSVFCYLYGSTDDIVWDSDCGGESDGCAEDDRDCQCQQEGYEYYDPETESCAGGY